jgi:hypothetical protein
VAATNQAAHPVTSDPIKEPGLEQLYDKLHYVSQAPYESISMKELFGITGEHPQFEEVVTFPLAGACFACVLTRNPGWDYLQYIVQQSSYLTDRAKVFKKLQETKWGNLYSVKTKVTTGKWKRIHSIDQHILVNNNQELRRKADPVRRMYFDEILMPMLGKYRKAIKLEYLPEYKDEKFLNLKEWHKHFCGGYSVLSHESCMARITYDPDKLTAAQIYVIGDAFRLAQEHLWVPRTMIKLRDELNLPPDKAFIAPTITKNIPDGHKVFCVHTTGIKWANAFPSWTFEKALDTLLDHEDIPFQEQPAKGINVQQTLRIGGGNFGMFYNTPTSMQKPLFLKNFSKIMELRYG